MTIPMLRRLGFIPLSLILAFGLIALPDTAHADCSPTSTNGILGGLGGAVVGGLLGSTIGGGSPDWPVSGPLRQSLEFHHEILPAPSPTGDWRRVA